jgi:hypothetical protein
MAMKKMTGAKKPVAKMAKMTGSKKTTAPAAVRSLKATSDQKNKALKKAKDNSQNKVEANRLLPKAKAKSSLSRFEPKSPYTNPTKVKARSEYKKIAENRKKNSVGK